MARSEFDDFMSDADALMWAIEQDPLLRSTIVTAMFLDHTPEWDAVRNRLERGVRLIPRMRQRVVEPAFGLGTPAWSDDPYFDLDYHARRVRNPDPTTDNYVYDLAGRAAMEAFDRDRPLWEYTLVEDLPGGRAAFVMKVHHSMTDGVGGIKLLLMLLDLEREPAPAAPDPEPRPLPQFTPMAVAMHRLAVQRDVVQHALRRAGPSAVGLMTELRHNALGLIGAGTGVLTSALRFLAPAITPESPLLQPRSLGRRVFSIDLPLDDLKRAAKATGVSLNDAFVGGVMGGLGRYHEARGVPAEQLRMIMPINVRGDAGGLGGNHFTPARVMMPAAIPDPAHRVNEISGRCRRLRAEPAVTMTEQLATVLNLLPRKAATALMGSMFKGADLVTSNVPGAPFPLYLGGAEIEQVYAFGPLSGTATNVTLLSHAGTCCIGVTVDLAAFPEPDELRRHLRGGFAEILALA
ncbi:MAG: wax ester/triacylglycerol synthase family O-acyltransferase [Actinomycetota bacterium]